MLKIYYDDDTDLDIYKDRTIAIIGYGIQGRSQALCLRDSGLNVMVSQREGGVNYEQAKKDGFKPVEANKAAKEADIIMILTQDHIQAGLYRKSVRRYLKKGKSIAFSHGFNIHFGQIKPHQDVDVWMIAPKGPGSLVRRQFEDGKGVPCLVAFFRITPFMIAIMANINLRSPQIFAKNHIYKIIITELKIFKKHFFKIGDLNIYFSSYP